MPSDPPHLDPATRLGPVHLTVSDLDRSLPFYEGVIGLQTRARDGHAAALGAGGEDVVVLHENPDARPAGRHAGLYHYALLFPTRAELARAAVRVATTRTAIQGASDHLTHEAIYLPDPDGIGIELAADRPRERWPDLSAVYRGGPQPLDVADLLSVVHGEPPVAQAEAGVRVGHVHLHVSDLEPATRFYRDGLGFDVMADLGSAVFVAAGGYHHHVAYNVWRGRGVPPAPADGVAGLDHWTLVVPGETQVAEVADRLERLDGDATRDDGGVVAADPSGIRVRVQPAA